MLWQDTKEVICCYPGDGVNWGNEAVQLGAGLQLVCSIYTQKIFYRTPGCKPTYPVYQSPERYSTTYSRLPPSPRNKRDGIKARQNFNTYLKYRQRRRCSFAPLVISGSSDDVSSGPRCSLYQVL